MPLNNCKPAIMLDVAFQSETNGVSSGLGLGKTPNCVSTDGKSMDESKDLELQAECQSAELVGGGGFGLTGQFGKIGGVAISKDGETYKKFDAGFPAEYPARYGAFPTADTWYVAGGSFPTNNSMPADTRIISHFMAVHGTSVVSLSFCVSGCVLVSFCVDNMMTYTHLMLRASSERFISLTLSVFSLIH